MSLWNLYYNQDKIPIISKRFLLPLCSSSLPPPLTPGDFSIAFCHYRLVWTSYINGIIHLSLGSSTQHNNDFRFIYVEAYMNNSFLLLLSIIPLHRCTTFCLFSHLLMNIWVSFGLGPIVEKKKSFYEHWC